jgi:hypothetical protein
MADKDNIELSLTCAICLEIASMDTAMETICCHHLFCAACIENVSTCPVCRENNVRVAPAHFVRRLIGSLKVPCPNNGCQATLTRSNLSDHVSTQCAYRQLTCPDPECQGLKFQRALFIEHLKGKHQEWILKNFANLWQTTDDEEQINRFASIRRQKSTSLSNAVDRVIVDCC